MQSIIVRYNSTKYGNSKQNHITKQLATLLISKIESLFIKTSPLWKEETSSMNSKTQVKPSQGAGGYFSRFVLVIIALTCIQLTSNNAFAQSIELSEQTIQQAKALC